MNYLVYIKGFKEKSAKEVCMSLREWCELFISGESAPVTTPSSDDLVDKMKNLMNKEDDFAAGSSSASEKEEKDEEKDEETSSHLPGKFLKIFYYYSSSTLLI